MELRAVLFDIDDTLYSTTAFADQARRQSAEALRRLGVAYPTHLLLRELEEIIAEFSSNDGRHYNRLLQRLPRRSVEGLNPAILVAGAIRAYHETKLTHLIPFPDILPALRSLARTELIRGIVTAGLEIKQAEKLLRLGIYEWLTPSAIFISDQIGVSKPNPKLYRRACDELGVRPEEAMYVGDNATTDVDPANAIGMVTVLCRRGGKYEGCVGRTRPRHAIRSFQELLAILEKSYGVKIERTATGRKPDRAAGPPRRPGAAPA
jgi:putative hydrolase of the HAD superfamily